MTRTTVRLWSAMPTSSRGRSLMVALAVVGTLNGCGVDPVPATRGTPVPRAPVTGPAYAVVSPGRAIPGGPRLVEGRRTTPLPPSTATVDWLADGNALVGDGVTARVLDPRTGRHVGRVLHIGATQPVVSPGGITVTQPRRLRIVSYSPGLRRRGVVDVPRSALRTEQPSLDPGNADLELGDAHLAGGATWVPWVVNSENDALTDHGVLRITSTSVTPVSRNRPVVRLTPSSDGRAVLVLVQDRGIEDCGGCTAAQHLEEWSTVTGEVVADYGMPPAYTKDWRVTRLDKLGGRVVVGFARSPGSERRATETWVRSDEGWAEVTSLRNRATSWQDRHALVTAYTGQRALGNGAGFTLSYGTSTLIPYADSCPDHDACLGVAAPGAMLDRE